MEKEIKKRCSINLEGEELVCNIRKITDYLKVIECVLKPKGEKIIISPFSVKIEGDIKRVSGDFDDKMFWLDINRKAKINVER